MSLRNVPSLRQRKARKRGEPRIVELREYRGTARYIILNVGRSLGFRFVLGVRLQQQAVVAQTFVCATRLPYEIFQILR